MRSDCSITAFRFVFCCNFLLLLFDYKNCRDLIMLITSANWSKVWPWHGAKANHRLLLLQRAVGFVSMQTVGGTTEETNETLTGEQWSADRTKPRCCSLRDQSTERQWGGRSLWWRANTNATWLIRAAHRSPAHHYSNLLSAAFLTPKSNCRLALHKKAAQFKTQIITMNQPEVDYTILI